MKMSYFPGCTLKNKATDLDMYARKCAEALGITLEEIENWQCCGGVFTASRDEVATKLSSVRILSEAQKKGQDLVTVCSACHNVVKQTNNAMLNDSEFASKVNRYMNEEPYNGETRIYHYLEMYNEELHILDKRWEICERVYGCDHPQNLAAVFDMARGYDRLSQIDEENRKIFLPDLSYHSSPNPNDSRKNNAAFFANVPNDFGHWPSILPVCPLMANR